MIAGLICLPSNCHPHTLQNIPQVDCVQPTVTGVITKGTPVGQLDVFASNNKDVTSLDQRLVALAITFSKPVTCDAMVKQQNQIRHQLHSTLRRM